MTTKGLWPFDERLRDSEYDVETSVAPISEGETATPLALPVTRGDRIIIEYADDADVPQAGTTEVVHFLGFRNDAVRLIEAKHHERYMEYLQENPYEQPGVTTSEGIYAFNERLLKHAERVTVERVDVPDGYRD